MNRRRASAAAVALGICLSTAPVIADERPLSAGILLSQCTHPALAPREACAAFILQSVDRNRSAYEPAYCLPPSAILGDIRARFIAWGGSERANLDLTADAGLAAALAEAFPCPLTQSG
jgi:hypothetical protein